VSNFEIAVAKLKETLRNVKFATLCRSVAKAQVVAPKAQVSGAQRFLFRSKYDSSYATFTPTLAYLNKGTKLCVITDIFGTSYSF
jgi:hypothetical protein